MVGVVSGRRGFAAATPYWCRARTCDLCKNDALGKEI
jgi:hypothetical protein